MSNNGIVIFLRLAAAMIVVSREMWDLGWERVQHYRVWTI